MRLGVVAVAACLALGACRSSAPAPGDPCSTAELGQGACIDGSHLLGCRTFSWQVEACRGPDGCTGPAGLARCDQRAGKALDRCDREGARVCSVDRSEVLGCDGNQLVPIAECRGNRGCYREPPEAPPRCDQGEAREGDPCENDGDHCAADGVTLLRCATSHRYVRERSCPGKRGCRRRTGDGATLLCDVSVGDVGESCREVQAGGAWCSRGGEQENECVDGSITFRRACPGGCSVTWSDDGRAYRVDCRADPAGSGLRPTTIK